MDSSGAVTATNSFGAMGLVSRRNGNDSVFYSFDASGTVAQRSAAGGTVLSNYLFSAHGNLISGSLADPFGYKAQFGYYTDNETGLQLLTFRYYESLSGRFITRDPIGYDGGINLYSYVNNRPTSLVDPLGLDGEDGSFLSLMGSYGKGILKGIGGAAIGTAKLPFDLFRNPSGTVSGIADDIGMRIRTMGQIAADPSAGKEAIIDAIMVLGPNKAMEILGGAGGDVIAFKGMASLGRKIRHSKEPEFGANCRIAPLGNATNHPLGKFPHYHRRVPDPNNPGQGMPGQGIGRHRPLEKKPTDKSFKDRF